MNKIIKIYAAIVTIVILVLTSRVQTFSEINKDLISDNYKLINMSKDLLMQIETNQMEYTDLMSKYLNAEYDAMTRVVAIYCND